MISAVISINLWLVFLPKFTRGSPITQNLALENDLLSGSITYMEVGCYVREWLMLRKCLTLGIPECLTRPVTFMVMDIRMTENEKL